MSLFYAIILGIIQGITEFLPVSSFGHTSAIRKYLGISGNFGILFSVFLHMGTLLSVCMVFKKDLLAVLKEYPGMIRDLMKNLDIYQKNKRSDEKRSYIKIITNPVRKLAAMLLVGSLPTFILAYYARRLVFIWSLSSILPAIGFMITGIVLLVTDFSNAGGNKGVREASFDQAMWIGICQGISVFPGISRSGLTISAGLICGYNILYAMKYSYMLSVPVVAGSFLYELSEFSSPAMNGNTIAACILGFLASAAAGYFMIRLCLKFVKKAQFRWFAFYCFFAGFISIAVNFM